MGQAPLALARLLQQVFSFCGYQSTIRADEDGLGWFTVYGFHGRDIENHEVMTDDVLNALEKEFLERWAELKKAGD